MTTLLRRAVLSVILAAAFASPSPAQSIRVPGTSVTLSPPEGFSPATQYPGFERQDVQATIMVTELPVPAAEMIRSMTAPALAGKGMIADSSQDVTIRNRPARLLHVRQETARGTALKWMLIAGDARMTIMIVGTFAETDSGDLSGAIRRSLLSASWGAAAPQSAYEGLAFRVTPTARLKLARRQSNMLMFTESGTTGSSGSNEALYIAGQSIGQARIGDLRAFAESRAKQTALTKGVTNFEGRTIQVDGADAYELEADAADAASGRAMRLYQVIIPDESGYFILQGLIRADRVREILPEFKALTASFRKVTPQ